MNAAVLTEVNEGLTGFTVMQTRKVCCNVPEPKIMIISVCRIAARWASAQNRMRGQGLDGRRGDLR